MYHAGIPPEFRPRNLTATRATSEADLIKAASLTLIRAQWPYDVVRCMTRRAVAARDKLELIDILREYVSFINEPLYIHAQNVISINAHRTRKTGEVENGTRN